MNRVRSPLFAVVLALALGCVHAPEPVSSPAEPAPPPTAKEVPPKEAPPPASPPPKAKAAERPATAKEKAAAASAASPTTATSGAKATTAKSAASPAPSVPATAQKAESGGPSDYFPLAVGNEWMYVDESPALPENRRGVMRTVRILERTADGFYRDNERGNLRVDGNCIRDRDRRLLCLPFTVGANWSSTLSATTIERYEIASTGETIETPAGKFERCVRVRAHNRVKASIDQVLEITYAPRVGPVLIETYVVVDGRVTPQVKAMLQSYKLNGGT